MFPVRETVLGTGGLGKVMLIPSWLCDSDNILECQVITSWSVRSYSLSRSTDRSECGRIMGLDQSKWHYLCKSTSLVNCSPPLRCVWDVNKMVWRKRLMAVLCFWQSFLLQGSTPPPCHRLDDCLMRRVQLRQQTAAPGEFLEITKKIHVDCNQIWYFSENTELTGINGSALSRFIHPSQESFNSPILQIRKL